MTAGLLWWGRTEYTVNTFDTSGADTFITYSANGQEDAVASQWPNAQYDNTGTLTAMTNNKWANLFFFLEPDGHIIMIYGRSEFNSQALAEVEGVPSTSLPTRVSETSLLTSRFTFQKSSNIAVISSAFDQLFANASVTDHGDLASLQGGTVGEYYHLTSAQHTVALAAITASSTDTFTNKTFDANGTGNSLSNVDVADLADGIDGELITWDAAGAPTTVAVGTVTHVLTSGGTGVAPTMQALPTEIQVACSDLTTAITTGNGKASFRMPFAMTLSEVRVSLDVAGTATGITVDINLTGSSIFTTTLLLTDATEETSETYSGTAPNITTTALTDDGKITIDFDAVPTAATGVVVTLIGTRT